MPNTDPWEQYLARRRALEATYWQVVADLGYDPQIGLPDAPRKARKRTPRKRQPRNRPPRWEATR